MKQIYYQLRYALPIWLSMIATAWLPDNRYSVRIRGLLVSFFLPGKPQGLTLGRDVTLLGIDRLYISSNVYLAKGVWINALGGLTIEDEVMLAPYVVVVTTKHLFKNNSVFGGDTTFAPVKISKGSWIGAHCTITPGSEIGNGSVVGANTVVTKIFPSYCLIGGKAGDIIKKMVTDEN